MGTNFYARIIPKEEDITYIIDKVNKYLKGLDLTLESIESTIDLKPIHLGKRSSGWQFIWENQPDYFKDNLESIKEFLSRKDVIIYDEYYNKYSCEEFFKEIKPCLYNDENHYINIEQYKEKCKYAQTVYSHYNNEWTTEDGLRFTEGEFC